MAPSGITSMMIRTEFESWWTSGHSQLIQKIKDLMTDQRPTTTNR